MDNRVMTKTVYDCSTGKMEEIEMTPEEIASLEPSLNSLKANKVTLFDATCETTILAGFTSSTLGSPHTYGFSTYDQMNMIQQMLLFQMDVTLTDVNWKTTDDGQIPLHTKDQFIQLTRDADTHKRGNIFKYWTLKAHILSATTKEELEAIVW